MSSESAPERSFTNGSASYPHEPRRSHEAEGLARLLELLTHYFKVELGHKLLDHFRIIADPQMLRASSRLPLSDNETITKLNRLVNIFHLLPSAANIFWKI